MEANKHQLLTDGRAVANFSSGSLLRTQLSILNRSRTQVPANCGDRKTK